MQNKKVIIYGAGNRARGAYALLKKQGYQICAFCDSDSKKIGEKINGISIMSREEIKKFWGKDFNVYISPMQPIYKEIYDDLINTGFVTEDRIVNKTRNYISCASLENIAIVSNSGISLCCWLGNIRNAAPYVEWKDTIEETVDAFIKKRDSLIEGIQGTGKGNPCKGCPELRRADWDIDRRVTQLALSLSYPCQLACCYCETSSNMKYIQNNQEEVKKAKNINIPLLVKCLQEKGDLTPMEPIDISSGEITIAPNKNELLKSVEQWPLQIFTNGVIYDEEVARLASREDGSFLNVSLDSGTAKTYQKIKGLDAFDRVKNTLKKYAEAGVKISLKYILLHENCTKEDYDGFLSIAEEVNAFVVNISCDIYAKPENQTREIIEGASYLVKECKKRNIPYKVMPYFGEKNLEHITEEIGENEL